jgi:hypothetical protein
MIVRYAVILVLILTTPAGQVAAQSSAPDGVLGRWELYATAGGSPLEVFEFAAGQRQMIHLFTDRIEIWGPQPWGSSLEEPIVYLLEWAAGSVIFNTPLGIETWPVSNTCAEAGVRLQTEVHFNPYGVSCLDPPCLMLAPGLSCPDAGGYFYVESQGVPVESTNFGLVKAIYR